MTRWIPLLCLPLLFGCGTTSEVAPEKGPDTLVSIREIQSRVAQDTNIANARFPAATRLDDSTVRIEAYVGVSSGYATMGVGKSGDTIVAVVSRSGPMVDWGAPFYCTSTVRFVGGCRHVRVSADRQFRMGAGDTVLDLR